MRRPSFTWLLLYNPDYVRATTHSLPGRADDHAALPGDTLLGPIKWMLRDLSETAR